MKNLSIAALTLCACTAWAQMTPVGTWHTIDDETNKPKGEVTITDNNGLLTGVVGRSLVDDPKAKTICDLCKDERKDQPILGMEIIRGLKQEGNKNLWGGGGKILDPTNGKIYTLEMEPIEGGKKMKVRGYIGPFYRTQIWLRVDQAK
ncbi:MAG: DUF2147 domain-containing protein [Betaproteobacteria bacterium]|nr:DUF2147 domain-containing protein [Betaproteobacteria bacterium]